MQTTGFAYNERGWLTNSTSPEFAMQLKYNNAEMGTKPNYNGNISNQLWGTAASLSNTFRYSYDALNRLTDGSTTTVPIQMSELLAYDVMGNIKKLKRDNAPLNEYHYIGNQLQTIDNVTVAAYGYDVNGNATTDGRTGISLGYNYLNLPSTATKTVNGTPVVGLTYTYDATGQKLKKVNSIGVGDTIDYIGGIQYRNGLIDFIQTEEGIARRSGNGYIYEYNLSDHLGNVRYTFRKNASSFTVEPLQADNYYAFGLRKPFLVGSTDNKYLYNGKELQDELSLPGQEGQYDYGARFYDPVVGRWNSVDPLAERMRRHSPYNYAFNNPIRFIDPDGMQGTDWVKKGNTWSWDSNITSEEQATAAGYDGYAAPGSVISDAKIGTDGPVGNVYLGSDGSEVGYTLDPVTVSNSSEGSSTEAWLAKVLTSWQSKDGDIGSGFYLTNSSNKTGGGEDSFVKWKPNAKGDIDHIEISDILSIGGAYGANPKNMLDKLEAINNLSGGKIQEITSKKAELWYVDPVRKDSVPESEARRRQIKRSGSENFSGWTHLGYLK